MRCLIPFSMTETGGAVQQTRTRYADFCVCLPHQEGGLACTARPPESITHCSGPRGSCQRLQVTLDPTHAEDRVRGTAVPGVACCMHARHTQVALHRHHVVGHLAGLAWRQAAIAAIRSSPVAGGPGT